MTYIQKNIDLIAPASQVEQFTIDVLSDEEKQFLDLLADIIVKDISNKALKENEN